MWNISITNNDKNDLKNVWESLEQKESDENKEGVAMWSGHAHFCISITNRGIKDLKPVWESLEQRESYENKGGVAKWNGHAHF